MKIEDKVNLIEDAIQLLKESALNHSERMDDFLKALEMERKEREESRKDFEFKLNALIDAQIKNEVDIRELKDSTIELRKSSEAQLKRIEILENK